MPLGVKSSSNEGLQESTVKLKSCPDHFCLALNVCPGKKTASSSKLDTSLVQVKLGEEREQKELGVESLMWRDRWARGNLLLQPTERFQTQSFKSPRP